MKNNLMPDTEQKGVLFDPDVVDVSLQPFPNIQQQKSGSSALPFCLTRISIVK
jgi:hypothetical protein